MGGRTLNMVRMRLDKETIARLGKEYFNNAEAIGLKGYQCGTDITEEYGPTSTVQKCKKIAGSDYFISHSELMIHHLFMNNYLPKNLRKHVRAAPPYFGDELNIFVGLPVIKYLLARKGIRIAGRPRTTVVKTDICNMHVPTHDWGKCSRYGGTYLYSAVYALEDLEITTNDYLCLMDGRAITAKKVFSSLMDLVTSELTNLTQGDRLMLKTIYGYSSK